MVEEIKNVGNITIKPTENGFRVDVLEITPEGFHKWKRFDNIKVIKLPKLEVEILGRSSVIQVFTPEDLTSCKVEVGTLACKKKKIKNF